MSVYTIHTSRDFFRHWVNMGLALKANYALTILLMVVFGLYFAVQLDMIEKLFALIISGKIPGSTHIITLEEVVAFGIVSVSAALTISTLGWINQQRNANKLVIRKTDSSPFSLDIRLA